MSEANFLDGGGFMVRHGSQGTANTALAGGISIAPALKAIILSYAITIPVFAALAFILANTSFPEKYIGAAVVATTIISVVAAGVWATRSAKRRGWLNGGIVGFVYMFVLYILSGVSYKNFAVNKYVITMAAIGVLAGAIGGILGINVKTSSHPQIKTKSK